MLEPSHKWMWKHNEIYYVVNRDADIVYLEILITILGPCESPGRCRPQRQCPWTCRSSVAFVDSDKDDTPPGGNKSKDVRPRAIKMLKGVFPELREHWENTGRSFKQVLLTHHFRVFQKHQLSNVWELFSSGSSRAFKTIGLRFLVSHFWYTNSQEKICLVRKMIVWGKGPRKVI